MNNKILIEGLWSGIIVFYLLIWSYLGLEILLGLYESGLFIERPYSMLFFSYYTAIAGFFICFVFFTKILIKSGLIDDNELIKW